MSYRCVCGHQAFWCSCARPKPGAALDEETARLVEKQRPLGTGLFSAHQHRVMDERTELHRRLAALNEFIASYRFNVVAPPERALMIAQADAMRAYHRALEGRVMLWESKLRAK